MSLDIDISVNEELSALLRGSLSDATERRVVAWARAQLAKKEAGLPYERLPGFYTPSQSSNNSGQEDLAAPWSPPSAPEESKQKINSTELYVSIIDEDSNYGNSQSNDWARFRSIHSNSYFVVLVPLFPGEDTSAVSMPSVFLSDKKASFAVVGRPGEGLGGQRWINTMPRGIQTSQNKVQSVSIWLDTSGSMEASTVSADLNVFLADVSRAYGVQPRLSSSDSENWIVPHF